MPAFRDTTKWPDDAVTAALYEAYAETGSKRWGGLVIDSPTNFRRRGMFLFAAHWLCVTYPQGTAEDAGDITPTARLNISAKSVGDESVTYRVGAIQDTQNDWLSLTDYGVQFLRLRIRAGMGAMAL